MPISRAVRHATSRVSATSRGRVRSTRFSRCSGDANRGREMQAAWRSFCRDRLEAVRGVLDAGRSPPEIAYQLGELLHNHFRTRGVTLTSYELRRLVAELLSLHDPADEPHEPAPTPPPATRRHCPRHRYRHHYRRLLPRRSRRRRRSRASPRARPRAAAPPAVVPVVAFEREPQQPWPGDVPQAPPPAVADKALEPPPSPIVKVAPREPAPLERLLSRAIDLAKGRSAAARPDRRRRGRAGRRACRCRLRRNGRPLRRTRPPASATAPEKPAVRLEKPPLRPRTRWRGWA